MSEQSGRPDLGKLLWPRTVALVSASPDVQSLRGRILQVMKGHPFAGTLYPVSRSHPEVMGLKTYPSVMELPTPADLAVLIIPAKHVPGELERCGKARPGDGGEGTARASRTLPADRGRRPLGRPVLGPARGVLDRRLAPKGRGS